MADWPYNTAAWQRLRAHKLAEKPLCEICERRGRVTPAKAVDHVVSIASGGDAFPPLDGLMAMCVSCHSTKTNALDKPSAAADRPAIAFKGCGLDGLPIDAAHPFLGGYTPSKDEARGAADRSGPSTQT